MALVVYGINKVEEDAVPTKRGPGQRPAKPPAGSVGSGRADLQIVFNWLKDEKKVKKVFRVIVDDLQEPSHQDEAIEACLRDIEGVGTWDWKKIDLSPDIIQNAARHAKIVHLYWSGRNIALRAWSEDRGLRQLEHLQEIHLHYQQVSDTHKHTSVGNTPFANENSQCDRDRVWNPRFE